MEDYTRIDKISREYWLKGKTYADWQKEHYKVRVDNFEKRVKEQKEEE